MSFLVEPLLLWWFRRRHPEWSVLKLRLGPGYRAYCGHHDIRAGTLRELAAQMAERTGQAEPGLPS